MEGMSARKETLYLCDAPRKVSYSSFNLCHSIYMRTLELLSEPILCPILA